LKPKIENIKNGLDATRVSLSHPLNESFDFDVFKEEWDEVEVDAADVAKDDNSSVSHVIIFALTDQIEGEPSLVFCGEGVAYLDRMSGNVFNCFDSVELHDFIFIIPWLVNLSKQVLDGVGEHPVFAGFIIGVIDLGSNLEEVFSQRRYSYFAYFSSSLLLQYIN